MLLGESLEDHRELPFPSCPVVSLTFLARFRYTEKSFSHPLLVRDFESSSKGWLSLKANFGIGIYCISCRLIQGLALKMDLSLTSPTKLSSLIPKSSLLQNLIKKVIVTKLSQ